MKEKLADVYLTVMCKITSGYMNFSMVLNHERLRNFWFVKIEFHTYFECLFNFNCRISIILARAVYSVRKIHVYCNIP